MKKVKYTFLICLIAIILLVIVCFVSAILLPARVSPTPSAEQRALSLVAEEYNSLQTGERYTASDFCLASMQVKKDSMVYYQVDFAESAKRPVHSVYAGTTAYYTGGTIVQDPADGTLQCSLQHMIID